jgi:hypothetical protein
MAGPSSLPPRRVFTLLRQIKQHRATIHCTTCPVLSRLYGARH